MHKTKYKQIALAVCFTFLPFSVQAAGLGKLTVISGLGEPLQAEIELVSTAPDELASLSAAIAPQEVYDVQGMARTAVHSAIRIDVVKKSGDQALLRLTTRQPVDDPFLDMLVQVDWATGRLLREYTVLLDPPGYRDMQPVVTAAAPSPPVTTATPLPATSPSPSSSATADQPAPDYTTRSGDTLHGIAKRMQLSGYSLDQMLVGLYRANKQAFVDDNMNRLKVGQIIKAPDSASLAEISPAEARQEVRVHTADWNAYRSQLAGYVAAAQPTAESAGEGAASGKLRAAAADGASPRTTGPQDVVRLSKNEAGVDSRALQDKLDALQEENTARQNSIEEANERVAALEKQIADLKVLLAIKNQTMTNLQDAAGSTVDSTTEMEPAATVEEEMPTETVEAAASEATVAEAETVTEQPKKKPVPVPEPAVEPPSLTDGLTNNPLLLTAAGGVLLLLGGSWLFLRNRRKQNLDNFERSILTEGGLKANTVFGNTAGGIVDTGDTTFLPGFPDNTGDMIDTHDVDPIAEAEVYMAYGRDTQAEEILNDAIEKEPKRYDLHLKLLEIFVGRNDPSAFEAVAGELYSSLGSSDPVWVKVAEMGAKLEPANPLYDLSKAHVAIADAAPASEPASSATVISPANELATLDASDFDSAELMTTASLDFPLDAGPASVAPIDTDDARSSEHSEERTLDFSLDLDVPAVDASQGEVLPALTDTVQLDVPNQQVETDQALDFSLDVPAVDDASSESSAARAMADTVQLDMSDEDTSEIDFNMDIPSFVSESSDLSPLEHGDESSTIDAATVDLAADLQMPDLMPVDSVESTVELAEDSVSAADDTVDAGSVTDAGIEVTDEDVTALDFNFDFNLGNNAPTADADQVELTSGLEMDLSDINLDLGDTATESAFEVSTGVEGEPEDVNTKLDLVTAYMDMGDTEGARELLEEILKEGGSNQRARAQELLNSLS